LWRNNVCRGIGSIRRGCQGRQSSFSEEECTNWRELDSRDAVGSAVSKRVHIYEAWVAISEKDCLLQSRRVSGKFKIAMENVDEEMERRSVRRRLDGGGDDDAMSTENNANVSDNEAPEEGLQSNNELALVGDKSSCTVPETVAPVEDPWNDDDDEFVEWFDDFDLAL